MSLFKYSVLVEPDLSYPIPRIVLQLSSPPSPSRSNLESSADQLSEPSKYLALTASLIYILSPSPATIASGYTEPPFAAMTFSGILCLIHLNNPHNLGRWRKAFFGIGAAAAFAVATSLRSLGVLNVGMVGWLGVVIPLKRLLTPRSQGNMMVSRCRGFEPHTQDWLTL